MLLKKKKPTSPGIRHQLSLEKTILYPDLKIKSLRERIIKKGGRDHYGHISVRHQGGGLRKIYKKISFDATPYKGVVVGILYDSNRTAFIAKVFDLELKKFKYILANKELYPGSIVGCGPKIDLRLGNRKPLSTIPVGMVLSILSKNNKTKGIFARSAGVSCQLIDKGELKSKVKLPSGQIIEVNSNSYATIGSIGNSPKRLEVLGKAGKNRYRGIRPSVRGVAMNPVDHPHGGGQGKTKGGRPSVTPWARPTKGQPTRKKK